MKSNIGNLKIGIDIDNVISDSYPAYIKEFNKTFGVDVRIEDVCDFYYFLQHEEVEKEEAQELVYTLLKNDDFQLSIKPLNLAREVIEKWSREGHSIHYITARPIITRESTNKWLEKYGFMVEEATLDLQDYFDVNNPEGKDAKYKKKVVERRRVNVLVEDSKDIAKWMDIPVYLIDRPWNQGDLPKNVVRVYDWSEIDKLISKKISLIE